MTDAFLVPGAEGWTLISRPENHNGGAWRVRAFETMEEAAQSLGEDDSFTLALPIGDVLAQRLRLPRVEEKELREMVRLQIEKALPFPPDEVTSDYEVIEQNENECVVSAVAVQNDRLSEVARALLDRQIIPRAVTVYAGHRAATHARQGRALFIYPEAGTLVSAIAENGKLSFARTLGANGAAAPLEFELPQFALNAELEGVGSGFSNVLVDEKCYELREVVDRSLGTKSEVVGMETPPAATGINLLPENWRERRARQVRRKEWRQWLVWAAMAYAGIVALALLHIGYLKFRLAQLGHAVASDEPKAAFVQASAASWRSLEPALDPRLFPIEVLRAIYESLPSADVHITAYTQAARQLSLEGEASSAALAYQFTEKVKKNPALQRFNFEMQPPRLLPNDHAQFRLEGKLR